jgi:6-pyruvoyltetrahydropterin/6-carboxytetrahydropterin synthase
MVQGSYPCNKDSRIVIFYHYASDFQEGFEQCQGFSVLSSHFAITMEKIIYLTRRERFNAAHKLWNPEWDAEKNANVFGKCSNPNWHGHNYELFVTVKGTPQEDTGFTMDLKVLSDLVEEKVISKLDHKNLNLDVDFMHGKMASAENIAIAIWEQLEEAIRTSGCKLHSIKLYETENNIVEYFGGN